MNLIMKPLQILLLPLKYLLKYLLKFKEAILILLVINLVEYIFIQLIDNTGILHLSHTTLVRLLSCIVSRAILFLPIIIYIGFRLRAPSTGYKHGYTNKIKEKRKTKVTIVSCMTVGPPTVGKTTLREQLLTDQCNNEPTKQHKRPLSTQVADKIKKIRLTDNNNNKWNHITSDEELTGFVKGLGKTKNHIFPSLNLMGVCFFVFMSPGIYLMFYQYVIFYLKGYFIEMSHFTYLTGETLLFFLLGFGAYYGMIYAMSLDLRDKYIEELNITTIIVRNAVRNNMFKEIQAIYSDTLIIHFRDSGGQPEFHEVIPALVSQSTLYLIMFNLNEDLEKEYNVTYKASEEDTSTGYESSFTVKETILQILASIQSLHNHTEPGILPSSALIIGTHRDKIQGRGQLRQIQQKLEKEIKGTDWYTSDAIATTPNGDLILPINTYNHNDVQLVKDTIKQSTAIRSYDVPVPFVTLYFTIEKLNKPVMSLFEFKCHAYGCNIDELEFNDVLQYLQDTMGAIRYFKSIPEMKDTVITDPQILFNLVNELILCTFTFKNIRTMSSRSQAERFHLSGRFKKQSLQETDIIKRGLLTANQVIAILIHLNIIAPVGINNEGYEEYFLPCVLVHAPVSVPASMLTVATGYSPLLVTFKCGYTPRGVFSCLISSILCSEEGRWVLASDKIYRNQVMFHLTESGHSILLKNCIKYLQVTVTVCRGSTISDVPFPEIRELLSQHLPSVITKLRYSASKVGHSFGFYCTLEDHATSDPHIAQCISNVQNPHIKCTVSPSPIHVTASLTPEQAIWFKDDYNLKRTIFDITHLSMVFQFLTKEHYDATTWQQLGLALGIIQPTLNKIESDARGKTEGCLRECLSAWLRQEDNVKESGIPNWYTLAKALDFIGQRSIADLAYVKH